MVLTQEAPEILQAGCKCVGKYCCDLAGVEWGPKLRSKRGRRGRKKGHKEKVENTKFIRKI